MSCGDAPHLHMLNLIAGSIPASLEFYRRLGVTVPPPADQHVQGVEPYTLYLPLPAAGHEYRRYGRRPALPEPHARVPAAAARASTRAGNPCSFGIRRTSVGRGERLPWQLRRPVPRARCRCAESAGPAGDRGHDRFPVAEAHDRVGGKAVSGADMHAQPGRGDVGPPSL